MYFTNILLPGSEVLIRKVDMNGLTGRDRHPGEQHEGRIGKVLAATSVMALSGEDYVPAEDEFPGTVFYMIEMQDGVFEFADYEFDVERRNVPPNLMGIVADARYSA